LKLISAAFFGLNYFHKYKIKTMEKGKFNALPENKRKLLNMSILGDTNSPNA